MSSNRKLKILLVTFLISAVILIASVTFGFLNVLSKFSQNRRPNILLVVADDLGWNDVSWNNPSVITPNLHKLALEGVILNQSYVQPMCTPSRAALMTGKYPFRYGLQNYVFKVLEPVGLPINLKTLPEKLQNLGYKTHLIGKWHLGYCAWQYTPLYRGFDSFFGYFTGAKNYFTHDRVVQVDGVVIDVGYNLYEDSNVVKQYNGTYSTFLFTDKVIQKLNEEGKNPFFLMYSPQNPHFPLEVPDNYTDLYSNETNIARRTYLGMVTSLDQSVGEIVDALKRNNQYENTLIVFTSDNGGDNVFGGNNWPLRGNKATVWEGGTRVPAFVHATFLKTRGYTNNKLIHIVDWFTTFLKLAGGESDGDIDGVDQWQVLNEDGQSARNEIVYNIDNTTVLSTAIRIGDYKLIVGDADGPNEWLTQQTEINTQSKNKGDEELQKWRTANNTQVEWTQLYNLKNDPCEKINIADNHPQIVLHLQSRLEKLQKEMIPSIHLPNDPSGYPYKWNGTFSPGWCQPLKIK